MNDHDRAAILYELLNPGKCWRDLPYYPRTASQDNKHRWIVGLQKMELPG